MKKPLLTKHVQKEIEEKDDSLDLAKKSVENLIINNLKDDVNNLCLENENLKEELDSEESLIKQLEEDIKFLRSENDFLHDQNKLLHEEIQKLKQQKLFDQHLFERINSLAPYNIMRMRVEKGWIYFSTTPANTQSSVFVPD